jgi:hypothetical protein
LTDDKQAAHEKNMEQMRDGIKGAEERGDSDTAKKLRAIEIVVNRGKKK